MRRALNSFRIFHIHGQRLLHDDVNTAAFRRTLDGAGVLEVHRQRLLHHHVNVAPRARLHHHGVIECAGERSHRFRLHAIQHCAQIREEHGVRQTVPLRVMPLERGVGVEDAGDLNVLPLGCGV